jgi:oligogalacturonide lyase
MTMLLKQIHPFSGRNNAMIYKNILILALALTLAPGFAQMGTRFPSERKVIHDPVTGAKLVFLTSTPAGDSKIYPTHNQWTSDGKWVVFRSARVRGEAFAVHEETGVIVQVTEGGYRGMLSVSRKSMKLYIMRRPSCVRKRVLEVVEINLEALFADSERGALQPSTAYERICGTIPEYLGARADNALDASEEWIWFRVSEEEAKKHLPEGTKLEEDFGPRGMGAGPSGIAGMNLKTGDIKYVVSVHFQAGHIQANPWKPGEIVFCWETGGKAPQRTWIVNADGTGLRPLYPEADYEWVTHEAVIGEDEVAIAILGHRDIPQVDPDPQKVNYPGMEKEWGNCGTREKPTGLGIVNIRTREMMIAGQIPFGSGFWHVHGSSDGRFATGDDFDRNLFLINRETREMILLTTGHKPTARDHVHPTFSPDGTKIEIQSAMLSDDDRSMNICVAHLPEEWLAADESDQ